MHRHTRIAVFSCLKELHRSYSVPLLTCVEINIDYVHVNLVFINNELILNQQAM